MTDVRVELNRLIITDESGKPLLGDAQIGQTFLLPLDGSGVRLRIEGVETASEQTSVFLYRMTYFDEMAQYWRPVCTPDSQGRSAGFPVLGDWDGEVFIPDANRWFLTCTSGARGKCILWGFDPWSEGSDQKHARRLYQSCQYMARADYSGDGHSYTKPGVAIRFIDAANKSAPFFVPTGYVFEAGWDENGAVCVATTRLSEILTMQALQFIAPTLTAGTCTQSEALQRGEVLLSSVPATGARTRGQ